MIRIQKCHKNKIGGVFKTVGQQYICLDSKEIRYINFVCAIKLGSPLENTALCRTLS
jgi:hypothetical protein